MDDPFNRDPAATYDSVTEIVPGVRRLTCPNPSAMTFTGTQTYLLGAERIIVIDPGPDDSGHLDRIVSAAAGGRITDIVVTHAHRDHAPGARPLAARTGARIHAHASPDETMSPRMKQLAADGGLGGGEGVDRAFRPDVLLSAGDRLVGTECALSVLHTPGHLSDHVSLALDGTGILFTGDTVMGWATTLVSPPEGDMTAFMASLHQLRARQDTLYLPGHGHPVRDPQEMLDYQIAHRNARMAQILEALADGAATPADLTGRLYTDIDPTLLPAAERNVLASLIALTDLGKANCDGPVTRSSSFRISG